MAKNNCKLLISCEGDILVAALSGELDHHGAVAVRTLIDKQISDTSPRKTVLDLSGLDFMDSSGLGLIMGRYALMSKMGGEFCVRNPNERVVKIFKLAGLERMVKVEQDGKESKK
ncbi:MAG: STAS domain-containing protein [Ruminococcaceae bacterium]|nr:STAS domain-containing protein [Oscillospiraceae bacterium]